MEKMAIGRKTGGRRPGSKNKRTKQLEVQMALVSERLAVSDSTMPLEVMLRVMRDPATAPLVRLEAAARAAPYCHARLQAIEHSGTAAVLVAPVLPPLAPHEVSQAVRKLLADAEQLAGLPAPANGASDSERLRAILDSDAPLTPELYSAVYGDEGKE
jgi:hypothetical protein